MGFSVLLPLKVICVWIHNVQYKHFHAPMHMLHKSLQQK